MSLFESESPKFDKEKTNSHGKIFTLDRDKNKSGKIDINDLDIDLGVLEEADEKIEAIPAIKQEEAYTAEIDIRYLSWTIESKGTFSNDSVYCIDDYYASNSLYTINDNSSIRKAA